MAYENGNGNGKKAWAFSDALNWAFNLLTAMGTLYALINQPNLARDIAGLTNRVAGDEMNVSNQLADHLRLDAIVRSQMDILEAQKNANMTNIARHESLLAALEGNMDRESRDRQLADQENRKDLDELRQDQKRYSEERLRIVDEVIDRISKDEQRIDALSDSVQKVKAWR